MRHVILRPISTGSHDLLPGEIVDTSGWRKVQPFITGRRLRVHLDADRIFFCSCDRQWISEAAIAAHGCELKSETVEFKAPIAAGGNPQPQKQHYHHNKR